MRYCLLLLVLSLGACADDGLTRSYSTSRDSAPETIAATQMPLSTPPGMAMRPIRPNTLGSDPGSTQTSVPEVGSLGQDALLEAAGPAAEPGIRATINENSGMAYPGPAFVDRLMTWTPPAGDYTPVITQSSGGGWFSRMF